MFNLLSRMVAPPSTTMVVPVTKRLASELSRSAEPALSPGSPMHMEAPYPRQTKNHQPNVRGDVPLVVATGGGA